MYYPTIYQCHYGDAENPVFTAGDAKLNSILLRYGVEELFCGKPTKYPWRVRVEDKHDGEDLPHYILDYGHEPKEGGGNPPSFLLDQFKSSAVKLSIVYCDNHSVDNEIKQEVGTATIWAYYDERGDEPDDEPTTREHMLKKAKAFAERYKNALAETFPDYYICCRY